MSRRQYKRRFSYAEALRRFMAGETRPELAADYGVTIDGIDYGLMIARRDVEEGVPTREVERTSNDLHLPPNCGYCGVRFSRRWLPKHEARCGAGLADRYLILAISGYRLDPDTSGSKGGNHIPSTSYYVCDNAYEGVVVAAFEPGDGVSSAKCRRRAERECRKMNAQVAA